MDVESTMYIGQRSSCLAKGRALTNPYGECYFLHGCGRPYRRDSEWLAFFDAIAEAIVRQIGPKTVLDAGCAMGFLVEALRRRGVEAFGIDISEYAIRNVHSEVRPYCRVASITEPLPREYDLIICIEVLEHLPLRDMEAAIVNFCEHSADVVFSSSPSDYKEATHENVQPPEYWAEQFARHGLFRDVDFDATFITPWAARFRKSHEPVPRIISAYERRLWRLLEENRARRELAMEQRGELADRHRELQELQKALAERDQRLGTAEAAVWQARLSELQAELNQERESAQRAEVRHRANREELTYKTAQLERELQEARKQAESVWEERSRLLADLEQQKIVTRLLEEQLEDLFALQREADRLRAEVASLTKILQTVLRSKTWRLTEPLRRVYSAIPWLKELPVFIRRVPLWPEHAGGLKGRSARIRGFRTMQKVLSYWRDHGLRALLKKSLAVLMRNKKNQVAPEVSRALFNGPKALDEVVRERFEALQPLRVFLIPHSVRRINLVTDSINKGSLYGGVGTAIIFAALLAEKRDCVLRVITRTERPHEHNLRRVLELNGVSLERNVEFTYANVGDPRAEVDVGDEDLFVTTSWWTTWSVKEGLGQEKIIYLLQEDERMFYPLGDDYLRCGEILKSPRMRFVVNSKLLYDHLVSEGFDNIRQRGCWFEPAFPREVFSPEEHKGDRRNFFFYGRPRNLRNLFYLGLEVIDAAISRQILDLNEWELFFVGKDLPALRVGPSYRPHVIENLDWAEYASLVRKMDLGLCLMYSPHSSYPPLDLAASGAVVVTNRFRNKNQLDMYSRNILCRDANIDSLVQGIADGARLAVDPDARNRNFRESAFVRDWRSSFENVLSLLD